MSRRPLICAALTALAILSSCSKKGGAEWSLKGNIEGASGVAVLVERPAGSSWVRVDSVTTAADGSFAVKGEAPVSPEIYRLRVADRTVYFPVDSIETLNLAGNYADLERNYSVSGSTSADIMTRVNRAVMAVADAEGDAAVASDSILLRDVAQIMSTDWGSIANYYVINKTLGNQRLFDPSRKFDRRIIGAVATGFATGHPESPYTKLLESNTIENQRTYSTSPLTLVVEETPIIEVKGLDAKGQERSLFDAWKDNKVVILNFTAYAADGSPSFQMALGEVYHKYHDRGVEIYQVSCDSDEFLWRTTAKDIPWIAVFNSPIDGAANLVNYGVAILPTTYVFDHDGKYFERVDDISTLGSVVAKML